MDNMSNIKNTLLGTKTKKAISYTIISIFLVIVISTAIVIIYNMYSTRMNYIIAQAEYDELRDLAYRRIIYVEEPTTDEYELDYFDFEDIDYDLSDFNLPGRVTSDYLRHRTRSLQRINSDYIGWIFIEDTRIDYPVVQGVDNVLYMDTTFRGERNPAGAIFMDYRNVNGWNSPLTVLYGHNSRNGSMFGSLNNDFLGKNVLIFAPNNEVLLYKIIDVRHTNVNDSAFQLIGVGEQAVVNYLSEMNIQQRFDVPADLNRLLLLSTCTNSRSDDDRLLLLAVKV
jgi:sortase B